MPHCGRSPWKRLVEVIALVAVTATIWFTVAYCSPCKALPGQVLNLLACKRQKVTGS